MIPDPLWSVHTKDEVVMDDAFVFFSHDQHLARSLVMVLIGFVS